MLRKRNLLIVFGLVTIVVAAGLIFSSHRVQKANKESTENQQLGYVVINNTDALSNLLLKRQEAVVEQALSDYILSNVSNKSESAYIVGSPILQSDGKVSIEVRVTSPQKDFQTIIDRNTYFDKVVLSVPSTNYQKIVPVYSSSQGD